MNFRKNVVNSLQNLVAMEMRYQNQFNIWRRQRLRQVHAQDIQVGREANGKPKYEGVGLYRAAEPLNAEDNYFEVEILDTGNLGTIGVGLVPQRYPMDSQPGWRAFSVGYHADDGNQVGDKIGCGIKFQAPEEMGGAQSQTAKVFFTHNGKEVGTSIIPIPAGGLYPAVGMHSEGEEVKLNLDAEWQYEDVISMAMIEYNGRGKSIHDVGLAQARYPLDTTYHYFEIEIVDPGENCYIAIGVARRNYPKHRHPGWNKGSIAYHADDGKIFVGSGVGDPFGPRCHKGDIMGCGILFPPDYDSEADSDLSPDDLECIDTADDYPTSDSDDEDLYGERLKPGFDDSGTKVQVGYL
ncbi:hypothetical protein KUTeg_023055 [Tegillarca granosa]|uniref:SPRY domain-containing protein n=1 Tax=Tegillarca granosa TaxID=220873 RepID=A0ABQ9E667_TEGGR|nr:hypothetical protein KUTeg_023055 [Tegillarca granosa]